jgi:DNA-binding NarL/FixJ family response regulator
MKTIYLIDDHGLVRGGLGKILETSGRLRVLGGANSVEEALSDLRAHPDLVTLDLQLPGLSGVPAVEAIRRVTPHSRILIISARLESGEVRELVSAGVHGYLPKDVRAEELLRAAETILEGEVYFSSKAANALVSGVRDSGRLDPGLSPRQLETLRLIEKGKKTNEIAEILMLSPKTIEKYRGEILRRLDCRNQFEALEKARSMNLL